MKRLSLSVKVMVFFLACVVVPLVAVSSFFFIRMRDNLSAMVQQHYETMLEEMSEDLRRQVLTLGRHMHALAESPVMTNTDFKITDKQKEMWKIQDLYKNLEDMTLIDLDGIVLTSTNYNYRGDWAKKSWYMSAREGRPTISRVHMIPSPRKVVMVFTHPICRKGNAVQYVLAGQMNMSQIWDMMDPVRFGETGVVLLTDENGNLISSHDKDKIFQRLEPEALRQRLLEEQEGHFVFHDAKGVEKVAFFSEISMEDADINLGWHILIIQDTTEAYAFLDRMKHQFVYLCVMSVVVLLLLPIVLNIIIIRPIRKLTEASRRIARGDLGEQVRVSSGDEIGELGEAFNHMSHNLKETTSSRDELMREVDRRVLAENGLEQSKAMLQKVLELMPIGVVVIGQGRKIQQINQELVRMLGAPSAASLIGRSCCDVLCQGHKDDCVVSEFNSLHLVETIFSDLAGRMIPVIKGILPIEINQEQYVVETYVDISDRVAAERKLKEAKDLAEEASSMKSQFVSNVSHEIRTPLNCIVGFAEVIQRSGSVEEAREKARVILKESDNLLRLVNDLLDSAKLESGKIVLEHETFDLHELLEGIQRAMYAQARQKGLEFKLAFAQGVPRFVKGDALRLRQSLMNLVANAIKFTERGHVIISVESSVLTEKKASLRFSVADTGIGIPKEKQKRIFDRFQQADGTITRRYGGTGLGISISQQLIQLMGGEIRIDSEEGRGSTFWFMIPVEVVADDPGLSSLAVVIPAPVQAVVSRKILVAEDDETGQDIVRLHLESAGHQVRIVSDGEQALAACREEEFDVIILDLQMPNMDGMTAAERIRVESPACQDKPILVLTANTSYAVAQACYARGVNEVLLKPLRREKLLDVVARWGGKSGKA